MRKEGLENLARSGHVEGKNIQGEVVDSLPDELR